MTNLIPRKSNPKDAETGLTQRQLEIVNFVFDNPQLKQEDVAKALGVTPGRISVILNHPKVLDAYPILARARVKGMVPRAVVRFSQLMEQGANLGVSEKVTTRVLDSQKILNPVEIKHTHELGRATIDELQRIVGESRQIHEPVIEGEIVPELGELPG